MSFRVGTSGQTDRVLVTVSMSSLAALIIFPYLWEGKLVFQVWAETDDPVYQSQGQNLTHHRKVSLPPWKEFGFLVNVSKHLD